MTRCLPRAGHRFTFTAPRSAFARFALLAALVTGPGHLLAASPDTPQASTSEDVRPFTLVDHFGRTVTDAQFLGKWLLVYFGYTHCPDACPTALSDVTAALGDLDPRKRDAIMAIFISVDPERDTPEVMKDYVEAFGDANIIGLTGTIGQVTAAEAVYRIRAQRYERKDGDYTMSHASTIQIIDPSGRFVALMRPEQIGEHLAGLLP